MLLRFIHQGNPRLQNLIDKGIKFFIIIIASSLALCLAFGAVSHLANVPWLLEIAGICFFIFLGTALIFLALSSILLVVILIDAIRRDGFFRLLLRLGLFYSMFFIMAIGAYYLKKKALLPLDAAMASLIPTLGLFLSREVYLLKQQVKADSMKMQENPVKE